MPAKMLAETDAGPLAGVFAEIRAGLGLGIVPNLFRAMAALHADVLLQNWIVFRRTLLEGDLPLWLKQLVCLAVASQDDCHYAVAFQRVWLRQGGRTAEQVIAQVEETGDSPALSAAARTVLRFALDYHRHPDRADGDALLVAGLSEDEVQEVIDTVLIASGMDSFALECDLPPDWAETVG